MTRRDDKRLTDRRAEVDAILSEARRLKETTTAVVKNSQKIHEQTNVEIERTRALLRQRGWVEK